MLAVCSSAGATTPPPSSTPIPPAQACNPSKPDSCPADHQCLCCCGTWVCMPPYLPCCALPCPEPTIPTPTPTCPPPPPIRCLPDYDLVCGTIDGCTTCQCVPRVTPTATPTPGGECNPLVNNCPFGTTCGCCCGAWECTTGIKICCELACVLPTPVSTPTPTPAEPCSGSPCSGTCVICPPCTPGTICPLAPCELGHCDGLAGSCGCVPGILTPTPTPTPTPTGIIIGIGDFCEPDRICPVPLLCLIDPPHQARVCSCVGDCDGNAEATVDELVTLVNVDLGSMGWSACPLGDANGDGQIDISEVISAVNNALYGCLVEPTPTPTPQCNSVPCGGSCLIYPPCTPGTVCPQYVLLGACELNPFNGCQCQPAQLVTPTPAPTPVLYHGHICCECEKATCTDVAWVEVEPVCPLGCETFMDAECEAPCHGGPASGPAVCVSLTPCASDADCDDGNGCSMDQCTIDGCTHACVCR